MAAIRVNMCWVYTDSSLYSFSITHSRTLFLDSAITIRWYVKLYLGLRLPSTHTICEWHPSVHQTLYLQLILILSIDLFRFFSVGYLSTNKWPTISVWTIDYSYLNMCLRDVYRCWPELEWRSSGVLVQMASASFLRTVSGRKLTANEFGLSHWFIS